MGYFTNGFIFESEPDFAAIGAGFPLCSVQGYQHVSLRTWLLDIWTEPKLKRSWLQNLLVRREDQVHFPFTDEIECLQTVDTGIVSTTQQFLSNFQLFFNIVPVEWEPYGVDECHLALTIAKLARTRSLFFKYDDECLDFACFASPDSIDRLRCHLEYFHIIHESGVTRIDPYYFSAEEQEPPQDVMDKIREVSPWPINEPVAIHDAFVLSSNLLALWPASAGNPDDLLGFDAFDNLSQDYRLVFEQHPQ